MTFTVYDAFTGESYVLDVEDLASLVALADGGATTLTVDVANLTITIG